MTALFWTTKDVCATEIKKEIQTQLHLVKMLE